jgi:hypothetical protein
MPLELPESRKHALDTAISQLRNARKNVFAVALSLDDEDLATDRISSVISQLRALAEGCEVVKGKRRPQESTESGETAPADTDTLAHYRSLTESE